MAYLDGNACMPFSRRMLALYHVALHAIGDIGQTPAVTQLALPVGIKRKFDAAAAKVMKKKMTPKTATPRPPGRPKTSKPASSKRSRSPSASIPVVSLLMA